MKNPSVKIKIQDILHLHEILKSYWTIPLVNFVLVLINDNNPALPGQLVISKTVVMIPQWQFLPGQL